MALIDDLLGDVPDPTLRRRLQAEIATLRREKKFGLVFEHHLPELVPIYSARIRRGTRVARRNGGIDSTFIVRQLLDGAALCQPEGPGDPETIGMEDLAVVKRFGEPIFPTLRAIDVIRGGGNNPHHILIEAENYHALQLLEWRYPARIDCIYVDPLRREREGAAITETDRGSVEPARRSNNAVFVCLSRLLNVPGHSLSVPDGS